MKDKSRIAAIAAASAFLSAALIAPALAHNPGRMTGGGSIVCSNGGFRVTHGFELHCIFPEGSDASLPNNLEVNWGGGQNFHLTILQTAVCTNQPGFDENPPEAGFDTMQATGTGTLNGVAGAVIAFTFTDAGEPGAGVDSASYLIKDPSGSVVLDCDASVLEQGGNHQAHRLTGSDAR